MKGKPSDSINNEHIGSTESMCQSLFKTPSSAVAMMLAIAIAAVAQFKVHLYDHLTIVHIMEIINQKTKSTSHSSYFLAEKDW